MKNAGMRAVVLTILLGLLAGPSAWGAVWYVSPSGSASGDGSAASPWDLTTAFNAPACVKPGDTILLRAGTYGTGGGTKYECYLKGTQDKPIYIRSYPGETAVIDGGLSANIDAALNDHCTYIVFQDMEITNSSLNRVGTRQDRISPLLLNATGCSARNLVIHDGGHPGVGIWTYAGTCELYGTLIWGCGITCNEPEYGYYNAPAGSAVYTGSNAGIKTIEQCIIFRNYTHGIKPYGPTGQVKGYRIVDNTSFETFAGGNIHIGDGATETLTEDIELWRNVTYRRPGTHAESVTFGVDGDNGDILIKDNYFVAAFDAPGEEKGAIHLRKWEDFEITGNTIISQETLPWYKSVVTPVSEVCDYNRYFGGSAQPFHDERAAAPYDWDDWKTETGFDTNSTFDAQYPSETNVVVVANKYEPGRGHITIYNFLGNPTVNVDISEVIRTGEYYEVRDAQNYFGSLVASGTYGGTHISIPMDQTTVAQPVGNNLYDGYEDIFVATAPYFGVFVITAPNRSKVWIEADDRLANEDGPATGQFTVHRTGSTASALTVHYNVSGTATASDDYSALSGSVTIAASETTATVTITPVDDAVDEAAETVVLQLVPHADDYEVDLTCFADTVIIGDDDGEGYGLLAHWKLDETTGTVAIDSGSAGNDMDVVDGTWTSSGIIGRAMEFDNADDYLTGAPLVANLSTYTISAWFKTETADTDRIYTEYSDASTSPVVAVQVDSYGRITFTHRDDADNLLQAVSGYIDADDGSWHHVVCVRDGGTLSVYLDDEYVAGDTDTSPGATTVNRALIGAANYNGFKHYFDGTLDDVRLYSYAMSSSDVTSLYEASFDTQAPTAPTNLALTGLDANVASFSWSASSDDTGVAGYVLYRDGAPVASSDGLTAADAGVPESATSSYTVKAYDDAGNLSAASTALGVTNGGLLSHWKLDETAGTTLTDSGPAGNDGTLVGGSWNESGKIRGALALDGTDDYATVEPSIANCSHYSISAWFKTSTDDTDKIYCEYSTTSGTPLLTVHADNYGRVYFNHRDDSGNMLAALSTDVGADDGDWHHIVCVRTPDSLKIYFDDDVVATASGTTLGATTVDEGLIGANYWNSIKNFFDGLLDDVKVYDRSLSADEVSALYAEGSCTNSDMQPPTAPGSLQITNVTASSVSLSWTAATDNVAVAGYRIYHNWTPVGTTTNLTYTDSGLDGGAWYTYHVTAYDAAGNVSDAAGGVETHTLLDPDNTAAFWALDDGTGATADDASPNENDGALSGSPAWTGTGAIDGALTFDGTDDYVAVDPTLAGNTTYAFSIWFKTTATSEMYLYHERNSADSTPLIFLSVNYGSEGRLRFYHKGNGGTIFSRIIYGPDAAFIEDANDGEWHHLVVVRDAADSFVFYYDGEPADSVTGTDPGATTMDTATLGAKRGTSTSYYFNGAIDQVRIYDEAIDEGKARCLYLEAEE